MLFGRSETDNAIENIEVCATTNMSSLDIVQMEINDWLSSEVRKLMLTGQEYYMNHTDIRNKKRTLANGVELLHRANNKLEHGFYRMLTDQKTGYLLSKNPSVSTASEQYQKELDALFDRSFWRLMKSVGREAINKGIAWVQVYIKQDASLGFKLIPSEQIIPLWLDSAHTEMNELIRVYEVLNYDGKKRELVRKVQHWSVGGVKYYVYHGGRLVEDVDVLNENEGAANSHLTIDGKPHNWERLPFVPFRYNDLEQPLIDTLKSLIDSFNVQASVDADLLEDIPKIVYKLAGYGGENLETFVRDLQQYWAINLQAGGDVDKLQTDPNTEAVNSLLERLRKDIIQFGKGVDTEAENLGAASGVALKFRYSGLDNDANIMESEFQYSLELLLWFVTQYLRVVGKGDFTNETVNVTFNRDQITNEAEIIQMCRDSAGVMPDKQIRAQHPWYDKDTEKLWEEQSQQEVESSSGYVDDVFGRFGRTEHTERSEREAELTGND